MKVPGCLAAVLLAACALPATAQNPLDREMTTQAPQWEDRAGQLPHESPWQRDRLAAAPGLPTAQPPAGVAFAGVW